MRILFITSEEEDYLSDSLLIGFRKIYGENCIDFPKKEILYKNCNLESIARVRGYGFTLYSGILKDIEIDRFHIRQKLEKNYFELIIFSDIWRQFGYYLQWSDCCDPRKTIFIDGQDTDQVYPYAGRWIRNPQLRSISKVNKHSIYFKRELTPNSQFNWWHRLVPQNLRSHLPFPSNLFPTAFSIPSEKIVQTAPKKTKTFPKHIVDQEVAKHVAHSMSKHAFSSENEYYLDLQTSKFGITTKRAGWDCLRHYEIAANGAVPCFRELSQKPITCAPHGFNPQNSITYRNYDDLMNQINQLSAADYAILQQNSINWARQNTTTSRAKELLKAYRLFQKSSE